MPSPSKRCAGPSSKRKPSRECSIDDVVSFSDIGMGVPLGFKASDIGCYRNPRMRVGGVLATHWIEVSHAQTRSIGRQTKIYVSELNLATIDGAVTNSK